MQKSRKYLALLPALILIIGLSIAPAFAKEGVSSGTQTGTISGSGATASASGFASLASIETAQNKAKVGNETKDSVRNKLETEIKTESKSLISKLKNTRKEHSAEQRKTNCEAAQSGLETKLGNLSKNALAFQVKIDGVLAKAIAYQQDNNLTVTNFDTLVATAQTAKVNSASSVSALSGLDTKLDCTKADVAQNVAGFKVAASKARTNLNTYKQAVRAVLVALKTAKGGN